QFIYKLHPQPTPPLFPYTTLFRSVSLRTNRMNPHREYAAKGRISAENPFRQRLASSRCRLLPSGSTAITRPPRPTIRAPRTVIRSEEHTSELQSLAYLVCRLLLEK